MELYKQMEDLTLIGVQVKTFPVGIKEAFGGLMKKLGPGRAYYGVSWMDENDTIVYYAMAEELFAREGDGYNYECLVLEKGYYQTETIRNWMDKTDSIKEVFHNLMGTDKPDSSHRCIEWYRSDEEMLCMIKAS